MKLQEPNYFFYTGLFAILIIGFFVFYDAFNFQSWQPVNKHWVSDLTSHAQTILELNSKKSTFPVYSLWFLSIYAITHIWYPNAFIFNNIAIVSIVFLSAIVSLKYVITYWVLKTNFTDSKKPYAAALFAFILMFVTPIISYYTALNYPNVPVLSNFHIILGNISPNQWHNSTLIFSMPANILLFYYSISRFDSNKYYDFIIMGCLVVLSLLCKPSYVLAFLPVLCGSIFVNNIKLGHYWSAFTKQIPIAIIALPIMAYQYHVTFTSAPAMQKTIIAPFLVMNAYSPHIGISLLLSFMFPLMMFLFYYDKFDRYVVMAWLVSLSALMLFLLLAESPNFQAGNYCWGCIAANYILFLFSVRLLLNQPSNLKALVCYAVLGLHFLSGLFLLTSFFVSQTSLII